jgi:hypothetical protein
MGAHLQMFLPTKTLSRIIVQDTKYILRKPLKITNFDDLPLQITAPAETNVSAKQ